MAGYCSVLVSLNAPFPPCDDEPHTTLLPPVPVEVPHTTLKPLATLLPQTTDVPHTTELPETLLPHTTDVPQTTDEPQTTEEGSTELFPLDSVTVPVEELYVAVGDSAEPTVAGALSVLLIAAARSTYPAPTVNRS